MLPPFLWMQVACGIACDMKLKTQCSTVLLAVHAMSIVGASSLFSLPMERVVCAAVPAGFSTVYVADCLTTYLQSTLR